MLGCSLAFDLPVNAEIDSMEGVVEVGDDVGISPSLRRATIDKVQADLRQKYDFLEEKRRELDFLEKGGDPLEFMFGNAASTSVQSTSLTNQAPDLFVTSEAKGSIAFTASTLGDSVESSGAPGMQSACEPICADNLMLFDVDTNSIDGDKISKQPKKSKFALADLSFNLDGSENAKDIGDCGSVGFAKIAYNRRRYKSQPGRHSACSSSSDMVLIQGINGSSLHSFDGNGDLEGLVTDRGQDPKGPPNSDLELKTPIGAASVETAPSNTQTDTGSGIVKVVKSITAPDKDDPANQAKVSDDPHNVDSLCGVHRYHRTQSIEEPYTFRTSEEMALEGRPYVTVAIIEPHDSANVDVKISPNGSVTDNIALDSHNIESVSSSNQTRHSLDGNNDTNVQANGTCLDASGAVTLAAAFGDHETIQVDHVSIERDEHRPNKNGKLVNNELNIFKESVEDKGFLLKADEGTNALVSGFEFEVERQTQIEPKYQGMAESMDVDNCGVSEAGRITDAPSSVNVDPKDDNFCKAGPEVSSGPSNCTLSKTEPPDGISDSASLVQTLPVTDLEENRADEDLILEEARIIEAKRKRIAQLSLSISLVDIHSRSRSHWDCVLQEMAWLANDFAQERLWKISAAAQVCHSVSLLSQLRLHEQNSVMESRKKAGFLARSVMEFWHSVERKSQGMEFLSCSRHHSPALQEYALRVQKNQSLEVQNVQVQAPVTPDRCSDVAITHTSLGDRSQEVTILYAIPPGAMQRYINSVKSYTVKYEKTGSSIPEELETSASDALADITNEEGEGETSTYDLHVNVDASKSSNHSPKKLKISTKAYGARNLEVVADSPFMQCLDNKVRSHRVLLGKRPADSLNVSFHTKRMRSSNRQRALCSFTAGPSACVQGPTKTDASSGDTNSFQDDQNTFNGVSPVSNNLELESMGDFEKHLGYESAEVSTQMNRKKARHSGSAYEQRWLVDFNFQSDQRDHSKKRTQNHQLESNGSRGLFGHHSMKKSKLMRQSIDNAIENSAQLGRSAPSPVASQTSNPHRFMKDVGRDRGKKTKSLMIPATSQSGYGSPWSLFEEQALVVLVHDLGPNWGLVSDAINSTLQFKCIFRKPKECKVRHKQMMDMTSGDGADSAEDSGSSQKNNSTLPGIPTGYARQLFQRLQGPLEEDTIKSHLEKMITIGQKLRCRRRQEPKQIQPPHASHKVALTQVSPNNRNGFPILTPLDLCDYGSGSDGLLGFAGGHSGILPVSNSTNSPVAVSGNMTTGNNFASSPVPTNSSSLRDSRYAISKSAPLTNGEQKLQQYNQTLAGRNASQSILPSPRSLPANDRGVRMLPGGNGVAAITAGGNRSLPIGRNGHQGASSPMANAANVISSSMSTMLSPVHAGVGCVRGNPVRPHEASHMMLDPQGQVMLPELQMQATQGSNQGLSPYAAISSSFPNHTSSPPVPSYPIHQQQHPNTIAPQQLHSVSPRHPHVQGTNHPSNLHHAYAIRLAKDRQMQQRRLQLQQQKQQQLFQQKHQQPQPQQLQQPHQQQQQQQQPQAQLPVSSPPPPHNSPQVSALNPDSPMTTVPQHEQQHQMMPHGSAQNAQIALSSMANQTGKQRRRQPPKQKNQTKSKKQEKVLNKVEKGNALHQNMAIEASGVNSIPENGEQSTYLLQGQGLYSSKPMNPISAGKPLVRQSSNLSQPVQRLLAGQGTSMSKHLQQMPCDSDGVNPGQVSPISPAKPHSQFLGRPKLLNQRQLSAERLLQQNHHINPESTQLQEREPQSDQIPMTNSSKRGTVLTSSRGSNDITSVANTISPTSSTPRGGSELSYDSSIPNTTAHPSPSTEPSSQVDQGSGERHVSENVPSVRHDVGMRSQQKPAHLQQPPHVFQQLQQQQESPSQQQTMPLSVSQPQTLLMGSLYVRPPDSILE